MKNNDNNLKQFYISSFLGDGCVIKTNQTIKISTNCKYEEYLKFKMKLLGMNKDIGYIEHNGYENAHIYTLYVGVNEVFDELHCKPIEDLVGMLDELGIALWFYDDGSLHKRCLFYNLNTHAFPEDVQREVFIPFFEKLGCKPRILYDRKKDGREFPYLFFPKGDGAHVIANILRKYPVDCYMYKHWDYTYLDAFTKLKEDNPDKTSMWYGFHAKRIAGEGKIHTDKKPSPKRK